ncbi:ABC transporter permease [Clostridium sp. DJ247]|uniref:ABC transporter permease n=1 Tax=Clostridium sp. DJ247 TaxID=2726188 RepID=UPI0016290DE8|nr:ABC transporter permease [Clostridium sp. DJ247]MBC2579791.1 ABC transporter permease [Clostridium sp. DJ247]
MKLKRLIAITKKEFIHIRRDKASLAIAIVMPIMMLLLFGFAVNTDVNDVSLAVYDGSKTIESRELISKFTNSDYFKIYGAVDSPEDVEKYISLGKVKVGLVIPPNYSRDLRRNTTAEVQVLVDGSDPTIARTATSYSILIGNNYSVNLKQIEITRSGLDKQSNIGVNLKPLVLYNPTMESSKFNIPGVIGLILQNITVILTAFAMVREREKGTMEQLIMTPVTPLELILGKLIPYTVIGFLDMILTLILGYIIFGVVVKGSLALLILLGTLFLICSLAMGMLISTVAKTQLQAMQASLAMILPSVLLSGFMFPREAMPKLIYYISNIIPMTYFLEILRSIMVKGVGFSYLIPQIISLSILIFVIVAVTLKKFSKTLD